MSLCVFLRRGVWLWFQSFFELSFATIITPASCSFIKSFNFSGKKAEVKGLCCFLLFVYFLFLFLFLFVLFFLFIFSFKEWQPLFPILEEMVTVSCHYNTGTQVKTLASNGLRLVGLSSFWRGSSCRARLWILESGVHLKIL